MDDYKVIKQFKYIKQQLNYKRFIVIAVYIVLITKYVKLLKLRHTLSSLPIDKFQFSNALYVMVVISVIVYAIDAVNLTLLKGKGIKYWEIIVIIISLITFNLTIVSNALHIISVMIGLITIGLVIYRTNKVNENITQYKEATAGKNIIEIALAILLLITLSIAGSFITMIIMIGILIYTLVRFANYGYSYDLYLEQVECSEEDLTLLLKQYEQEHGKLK